jgi:phosphoribosylamine--glycine ligase
VIFWKSLYVLNGWSGCGERRFDYSWFDRSKEELRNMLVNKIWCRGSVVIEEFLDGIELSCFVLTDGKTTNLPTAKDYKRIGEGDTGLNTGGMGAVVPYVDAVLMEKIETRIVKPQLTVSRKMGYRTKVLCLLD